MPTLTQEPIAVAGEPPVVSHGEVIAPDFSNFLLLDKAAACFRSSLFLALKKVQEGCFNGIGYIFYADADGQKEMNIF